MYPNHHLTTQPKLQMMMVIKPKLLMVMGDPERDPRKHIVSIVYEIQVSEDQTPTAGDDAQDARFWPIETLLSGEVEFAGDHLTILKNWLNQ